MFFLLIMGFLCAIWKLPYLYNKLGLLLNIIFFLDMNKVLLQKPQATGHCTELKTFANFVYVRNFSNFSKQLKLSYKFQHKLKIFSKSQKKTYHKPLYISDLFLKANNRN